MAKPNLTILDHDNDFVNRSGVTFSTLSGDVANHPPENVAHGHIAESWQNTTISTITPIGLRLNLGAAREVDCIFLFGTNLHGQTGSVRFYMHTSALGSLKSSWEGSAAYKEDMTEVNGNFFLYPSSSKTYQYCAWFFDYSTASGFNYIEVGRAMLGMKITFSTQFKQAIKDRKVYKNDGFEHKSGAVSGVQRQEMRGFTLDFGFVNSTDRAKWVQFADRVQNLKTFALHVPGDSGNTYVDNALIYAKRMQPEKEIQYHESVLNRIGHQEEIREAL